MMALPRLGALEPEDNDVLLDAARRARQRAREEGITSFSALVLAGNEPMLNLLAKLGRVRTVHREQGTVDLTIELPETGSRRSHRGSAVAPPPKIATKPAIRCPSTNNSGSQSRLQALKERYCRFGRILAGRLMPPSATRSRNGA
jgi:hypothetical protein